MGIPNSRILRKIIPQEQNSGKTLGIIGLGHIGLEVAKIALGIGMKVIASDDKVGEAAITLHFYNEQTVSIPIKTEPVKDVIRDSDFISLHIPAQKNQFSEKRNLK